MKLEVGKAYRTVKEHLKAEILSVDYNDQALGWLVTKGGTKICHAWDLDGTHIFGNIQLRLEETPKEMWGILKVPKGDNPWIAMEVFTSKEAAIAKVKDLKNGNPDPKLTRTIVKLVEDPA